MSLLWGSYEGIGPSRTHQGQKRAEGAKRGEKQAERKRARQSPSKRLQQGFLIQLCMLERFKAIQAGYEPFLKESRGHVRKFERV